MTEVQTANKQTNKKTIFSLCTEDFFKQNKSQYSQFSQFHFPNSNKILYNNFIFLKIKDDSKRDVCFKKHL